MKKFLFSIILFMFIMIPNVSAKNNVTIYFFRGYDCDFCEAALDFINNHKEEIPEEVEIVTYEVWKNTENEKLHQALIQKLEVPSSSKDSVPFLVIGDQYQIGMTSDQKSFDKVMNIAKSFIDDEEYEDVVEEIMKENNYNVSSLSLSDLYSEPNKTVTIIVYAVFGVIVLGFLGMILFSRK